LPSSTIHGNGQHRRSFVYVSDVAEAFDLILQKGQLGSIYNIGTQFEISNLDVAKALLKCFGLEDASRWIVFVEDRNWNDVRYHINLEKLTGLGWSPKVNFCEGLKRTIQWYSDNPDHFGNISTALVPHPRPGLASEPSFQFFC